jgi:hypothetical protein
MIQISDVLQVADRLKINVTHRDAMWVLDNYDEDSDPSATWDLIVENLLHQIPMPTIEEYINSDNKELMLYMTNYDMEFREFQGYFFGRVEPHMNFYNTIHCGCEGDCCGCLSSVSQTAEQESENTILITKIYNFNY